MATLANAGTNIIAINVASVTLDFMEEDAVRIPAYPILCADNDAILKTAAVVQCVSTDGPYSQWWPFP